MNRRNLLLGGAGALGAAVFGLSAPRWLWGAGRDLSKGVHDMSSHPFLRASLDVAWKLGKLHAKLTVKNTSQSESGLVFEHNLPVSGDLENNVFESSSPKGPMRYVGTYSKRPAPKRGDFLEIPPLGEEDFELELTSFYDVPRLTTVTIWYAAYHSPPDSKELWELESNKVVIDT